MPSGSTTTSNAHLALLDVLVNWRDHIARDDYYWTSIRMHDEAFKTHVLDAVVMLDLALTGSGSNRDRAADERALRDAMYGSPWVIYLSDGGWSRVGFDLYGTGVGIWLTPESSDAVWRRWNSLGSQP